MVFQQREWVSVGELHQNNLDLEKQSDFLCGIEAAKLLFFETGIKIKISIKTINSYRRRVDNYSGFTFADIIVGKLFDHSLLPGCSVFTLVTFCCIFKT